MHKDCTTISRGGASYYHDDSTTNMHEGSQIFCIDIDCDDMQVKEHIVMLETQGSKQEAKTHGDHVNETLLCKYDVIPPKHDKFVGLGGSNPLADKDILTKFYRIPLYNGNILEVEEATNDEVKIRSEVVKRNNKLANSKVEEAIELAFDKEGMAKILLKNIYHYHELPNHIQLNHPMKNLVATDLTHIYRAFTKNMKEDQMR
ncbi:hypothetical protein GOP47_0001158 [Adiantum capillus-veneris]|nr:hypothetical protein GOP47_0001158 [Adiantum capillus-veneris]